MDAPHVAFGSHDLTVGTFANLVVIYACGPVLAADLERMTAAHADVIARHPGATGVLAIASPSAPVPSAEVREASGRMMREIAPHLLATALVVECGGFRGAAIRSFLTAVHFVAKQPFPTKTFARVDEACAWLAPRLRLIPSQVHGSVQTITGALPPRRLATQR